MSSSFQASSLRAPTIGLAGIGLVPALGATALAQEAPQPAAQLPELNIQGAAPAPYRADSAPMPRLPMTAGEMPQTVNIVPRVVIQEQAAATVRDALRNVTGISLAAGEGGFSGDNLTLRGFSARGDFYIDGIRDMGQYTRDSFFLESVDVLKGPSSVLFGRGSTGGVINQRTRLPLAATQGEVWLSGYSFGGVRSTADVNVRAGEVAARVVAVGSRIDAAEREPRLQRALGRLPLGDLRHGHADDADPLLPAPGGGQHADYGVPYYLGRPLPVATNTFYGLAQTDGERTITDVFTARLEHRFDENATVRNTFRLAGYWRDISATAPRLVANTVANGHHRGFPDQPPAPGAHRLRQPDRQPDRGRLRLRHLRPAPQPARRPRARPRILGAHALRPDRASTANLLFPDFYDVGNIRTTPTSDIKTVADTLGVFAVDRIRIGEMFEVILGGRYDNFSAHQDNRHNGQSFERTDAEFTWRAAFVVKPTTTVRTYLAAGTSFNPSAESLTLAANNANLAPETATTYELGGSWDVLEGLRLNGSLFRIEKRNARTSDPANDTLQVLDGIVRVDGFEISATGSITEDWNVLVGYTRLESEIVESNRPAEVGKEFSNVAPNTVALWTTYNLPYGLQIGGGLSFVDRRYGNTTNTVVAPSYTRFDAALAWEPQDGPLRGMRFQLNALNLGDARTYETVYTGHVVPGTGRTIVASVAARF